MELTINIKEQQKTAFFLKLLQEFDYIEITDIKDDEGTISEEHKALIDRRLNQIENGETSFQAWDIIKQKYEKKAI
jgi:hypothetical protein